MKKINQPNKPAQNVIKSDIIFSQSFQHFFPCCRSPCPLEGADDCHWVSLSLTNTDWVICVFILTHFPSQSTFSWFGGNSGSFPSVFLCTLIQPGRQGKGFRPALTQLQVTSFPTLFPAVSCSLWDNSVHLWQHLYTSTSSKCLLWSCSMRNTPLFTKL